jgi:IS30 family transposase
MTKPRLTEADRLRIEEGLRKRLTVYAIAKELGRPMRTIMREKGRARDGPCFPPGLAFRPAFLISK